MFGGSHASNRFERITTLLGAYIVSVQSAFDASQPYPADVQRGIERRRRLQEEGRLPSGGEQLAPRYLHRCTSTITTGRALNDVVRTPDDVAAVRLPSEPTVQGGRVPARPNTRVYVHAQIAVREVETMGFSNSMQKVCVGTPVGLLGFLMDVRGGRIRCPPKKRVEMLADIAAQARRASEELLVSTAAAGARRRLVNLSQIYPELRLYTHGGHRIAECRVGRRHWRPAELRLSPQRAAQVGWLALLEEGRALIEANEGVPLAPCEAQPRRDEPGVHTSTTDASGVDGVGGYVFIADAPGHVWLVSERWPQDIRRSSRRPRRKAGSGWWQGRAGCHCCPCRRRSCWACGWCRRQWRALAGGGRGWFTPSETARRRWRR